MNNFDKCPLCQSGSISEYFHDKKRVYLECRRCHLVFVPAVHHLTSEAEKAEYDKHQNSPLDQGYRQFLGRCLDPLFELLAETAKGLDFGCGPGPAISVMAEEKGWQVENYDLYYYHQPELLTRSYDFITMTEVIEHLAAPLEVLEILNKSMNNKGILAVMTKRVRDKAAFANWHYKNDPTHISFFSEVTFDWIAAHMGWRLQIVDKDVVFFHKD